MTSAPLPRYRRIVAQNVDQIGEVLERLQAADAIGVDVEMAQRIERLPGGVTRGRQILALIQLAGDGLSAIVDPLRLKEIDTLEPLMSGPAIKVVLGGATDIQLLEERGLTIRNVVDLAEMAVSVFGHKEEGMRALADRALGITIDKAIRREDWMRRPIDPAMVSYAHRDAELTLALYRWFQEHHPKVVASHIRTHYRPALPPDIAVWIRKYLSKRIDPVRLLKDEGLNPEKHARRLERDVRKAAGEDLSPAQRRRIIRLIGDLRMASLYDDVVPYASSPSSVFRSSAARTLGKLGREDARPILTALSQDELEDVRKAAETALRDLEAGPPKPVEDSENDGPGLDPESLSTLERLKEQLGPDAGT